MYLQDFVSLGFLIPLYLALIVGISGLLPQFPFWKTYYPDEYDALVNMVTTFYTPSVILIVCFALCLAYSKEVRKFFKNIIIMLLGGLTAECHTALIDSLSKTIESLQMKVESLEKGTDMTVVTKTYWQNIADLEKKKNSELMEEIQSKIKWIDDVNMDKRKVYNDLMAVAKERTDYMNRAWNAETGLKRMAERFEYANQQKQNLMKEIEKMKAEYEKKLGANDGVIQKLNSQVQGMSKDCKTKFNEKDKEIEKLKEKVEVLEREKHDAKEQYEAKDATIEQLHYELHELKEDKLPDLKKKLGKSQSIRKKLVTKNEELNGTITTLNEKVLEHEKMVTAIVGKAIVLENHAIALEQEQTTFQEKIAALDEENSTLEETNNELERKMQDALMLSLNTQKRFERMERLWKQGKAYQKLSPGKSSKEIHVQYKQSLQSSSKEVRSEYEQSPERPSKRVQTEREESSKGVQTECEKSPEMSSKGIQVDCEGGETTKSELEVDGKTASV